MIELIQTLQFMGAIAENGEVAAEPAGIAALGIDPLAILAQGFTFLLLFFVIRKYALNSIVATLEKRRQTIDDGVRLGVEMEKEKARLDEDVEKVLAGARVEADKIIASGHHEASVIIKQAEETAGRKADVILADAQAHITEEIKRARMGLEKEVAAMVADATEVIIGEKMNAEKDKGLLRRALESVGR